VVSEEELMDIRALSRQGYTYAEIAGWSAVTGGR